MVAKLCLSGTSPTIDVIGMRMLLGLATIMMVWFGVQEALASAHGGPGFSMGKFLNFVMLLSFAYAFVYYYDSCNSRGGLLAYRLRSTEGHPRSQTPSGQIRRTR